MERGCISTSDLKEERTDNWLGGIAIILLGVLLSGSAIWGLVDNVYSMNGGLGPPLIILLGVSSIIMGVAIIIHKPGQSGLQSDTV